MRLRFAIRDLLWLTVVIALAVGWWLDHQRLAPDWKQSPYHALIDGPDAGQPTSTTHKLDRYVPLDQVPSK
jgi:hypothetical protein